MTWRSTPHDSIPALMRAARGSYAQVVRDRLEDSGFPDIPRNGAFVLGAMANWGGTSGQVVEGLGISKQAASQLIDTLVVRGYLSRQVNPDDRRRLTIEPTERGIAAAYAVRSAVDEVDAELSEVLSDSELLGLRTGLAALANLKAARTRESDPDGDDPPSVFEFAGGEEAFLRLARAHHERCLADPVLNHPFSHPGHPQHVERLAAYWGEVFGGPPSYTSLAGGHIPMLTIHAGSGAEGDIGDRFVACFVAAADDAELPEDLKLRAVLRDYMQWAVDEVMSYAPAGSEVPVSGPVPLWGWDGLKQRRSP